MSAKGEEVPPAGRQGEVCTALRALIKKVFVPLVINRRRTTHKPEDPQIPKISVSAEQCTDIRLLLPQEEQRIQ